MKLVIELPPPPKALDRNHGTGNWKAKTGKVRQARSNAGLAALEQLRRGPRLPKGWKPAYLHVTTYWYGHRVDVDNALANVKAYQDGIMKVLGADDRELQEGHSVVMHLPQELKEYHRWVRYVLTDDWGEFDLEIRGAHTAGSDNGLRDGGRVLHLLWKAAQDKRKH